MLGVNLVRPRSQPFVKHTLPPPAPDHPADPPAPTPNVSVSCPRVAQTPRNANVNYEATPHSLLQAITSFMRSTIEYSKHESFHTVRVRKTGTEAAGWRPKGANDLSSCPATSPANQTSGAGIG